MVFIFRIQREHKIIHLSCKGWVKYSLHVGKIQQQVSSHLLCLQKHGNITSETDKNTSYKLYKN